MFAGTRDRGGAGRPRLDDDDHDGRNRRRPQWRQRRFHTGGFGWNRRKRRRDESTPGEALRTRSDSGDSAICRQYCSDIMDYCPGDLKQYVDTAQCLKSCAFFPEGLITDADGNTASCRLKYAGKARYALGTERDAYCRKAGPGSEGTCGGICDGFCTLMMGTCTPKFAPYIFPSLADCLTACRALKDAPPYTVSDGTLARPQRCSVSSFPRLLGGHGP